MSAWGMTALCAGAIKCDWGEWSPGKVSPGEIPGSSRFLGKATLSAQIGPKEHESHSYTV